MAFLKSHWLITAISLCALTCAFGTVVLLAHVSAAQPVAHATTIAPTDAPVLDGQTFVSNEFAFKLSAIENTATDRGNSLISHQGGQFTIVAPGEHQFADYDLGTFLISNHFSLATELHGGIKTIIEIAGHRFALVGLQGENCVSGALIDLEAMQIADKFPCLPTPKELIELRQLGGGHAIDNNQLFLALGAPGKEPGEAASQLAQNPTSPYGKMLRYDIETNPSGVQLVNREIYSSGHRNPQGMIVHNDKLIAVEHGPKGGDEINIIARGKNYGWPNYSLGSAYDNTDVPAFAVQSSENTDPLFAFTPSIGISDLSPCPDIIAHRYSGADCLLVSSLVGQSLFIVIADLDAQRVLSAERVELGARIRQVFLRNDILHILTDYEGMYRVDIERF